MDIGLIGLYDVFGLAIFVVVFGVFIYKIKKD